MSEPTGKYKMRFICDKDGRLLKGAPGNYECGRIYNQPYRMSKFKFWELIEEPPEFKVPPMSDADSVYSDAEAVFIPPELDEEYGEEDGEEEASVEAYQPLSLPDEDEVNVDPDAPAVIEPYIKFNPASGKVTGRSDEGEVTVSEPILEEEVEEDEPESDEPAPDSDGITREEIFSILDEAGVEYSKHTATPYLLEKIEELEAEESMVEEPEDASTQG